MKIYLAGPMRGMPYFNFPVFAAVTEDLRSQGQEVFSPAEQDIQTLQVDISVDNPMGDLEQAVTQHGFNLRDAMARNMAWICAQAEMVVLLPGWKRSLGAQAEVALARALGLDIGEYEC